MQEPRYYLEFLLCRLPYSRRHYQIQRTLGGSNAYFITMDAFKHLPLNPMLHLSSPGRWRVMRYGRGHKPRCVWTVFIQGVVPEIIRRLDKPIHVRDVRRYLDGTVH